MSRDRAKRKGKAGTDASPIRVCSGGRQDICHRHDGRQGEWAGKAIWRQTEIPPVSEDTPMYCHSMGMTALMLTEVEELGEREGSGIGELVRSEHRERFCLTLH